MINLKKEMLMNFFINLIKEVSMQLLNGNANFETLKEMLLERKNLLLKNKRNEDFYK